MNSPRQPHPSFIEKTIRWPLIWVGLALLILGSGVLLYANRTYENHVRQAAIDRAKAHVLGLSQFRLFYEQALLPRAMQAGVPFTEDERSSRNALPLPASLMADMSLFLAKKAGDIQVRFYSDVPLSGRAVPVELDAFQKQALVALRSQPEVPFVQEEIRNGIRVLRYAQADRVAVQCVACGASSGNERAAQAEVVGALEVVLPIETSEVSSMFTVKYTLLTQSVAVLFCLLWVWWMLKGFRGALLKGQKLSSEREAVLAQLSQEVDQRKKEERQRRLSESKLQSLFTSVPEAIVVSDAQRRIVQCNFETVAIFGYPSEDLIGKKIDVLMAPQEMIEPEQPMAEFLRTRESTLLNQAQVMTGRRKNGQLFSLRMTFSEMRVDEDILYVTVMQDFSGTENTQKLLSQAKEKAEEDRQLRGEFLAKMSYEIRTPMNGIVGMTELAMDTPDRAEQKEYLTLARNSANHLLHIINQILDFSKIEANALKLELQDVSPAQWLEKSVEDMVPWARAKNIDLLTDLSPQLPLLVRMDPVRMQQVLTNLIGNAIKFTDLGAVTVAMQAHSAASADKCVLRISITDTGKGFDSSRSASLFNPFNQVDDSDKRIFGSTGLGLAITRSLVHLMGGEIIANSQPELGACFTVALPVDLVSMAPEQVRLVQAQLDKHPVSKDRGLVPRVDDSPLMVQSMTTRQGEQVSVLLVEDHEINRKLAEIMIERMGCRLVSVRDGLQALDAMDKTRFDVVLMDVMMPVMDGLAALKLVREREKGTGFRSRVLMVTAHAMAGDRERFLNAGADGYVSKPMSQASLQTEIERVLALEEGEEPAI